MFVRKKKKAESRWQIQIVESKKVDGKTKQIIVSNIGTARSEDELVEMMAIGEKSLIEIKNRRNPVLPFAKPEEFHQPKKRSETPSLNLNLMKEVKRVNKGFDMVMKPLFDEMGFDCGDEETNGIVGSLAVARAFEPTSKLKAQKILSSKFDQEIDLHKIYRSLDSLADNEESIKQKIGQKSLDLLNNKVDVMFFDVTTLAFESQKSDDLRAFGFSKDCKFNEVQVVLAMVTTLEGLPITYELFPGNKFEGHTLLPVIKKLRQTFDIKRVTLAADRGMFSAENLKALNEENIEYVVGAKLKIMSKLQKENILSDEGVKPVQVGKDFLWTKEIDVTKDHNHKQKLVVSYSSKRAKKDAADRMKLVERLLNKAKDGKVAYDKLIGNAGTKKYIKTDGKSQAEIDTAKIQRDQAWDGIHGLITNTDLPEKKVIERYRGLWQIEEAFRVNKHDLKMRPIYHWSPKRIRGHICLCFITYALSKQIHFTLRSNQVKISVKAFLEELSEIQASILEHKISKKRYLLPSALTDAAKNILKVFNIKPKTAVVKI